MEIILWILAVVLVVSGVVGLVRGEVLWGIVLIVVGLLVGPAARVCSRERCSGGQTGGHGSDGHGHS